MKTFLKRRSSTWIVVALTLPLLLLGATQEVNADLLVFNSLVPANNTATRANWLSAAGITSPDYLVDFESGFANYQNVSGIAEIEGMRGLYIGHSIISRSVLIGIERAVREMKDLIDASIIDLKP